MNMQIINREVFGQSARTARSQLLKVVFMSSAKKKQTWLTGRCTVNR